MYGEKPWPAENQVTAVFLQYKILLIMKYVLQDEQNAFVWAQCKICNDMTLKTIIMKNTEYAQDESI